MSLAEDNKLEPTLVVNTTNGPIQGYVEDTLQVFKGVRYGAPPVGKLRFKPPVRPQPWTDVADATQLGAPALQGGGRPGEPSGGRSAGDPSAPGQPGQAEDCLFINIWTPQLDLAKRPVMVWLHGGGFTNGSGGASMYDGGNLARRGDVVTVTVNHRLNIFGYLHLGDVGGDPSSGEAGMLDIVLVLEWVRDNIVAFGGDPDNVTIFGESGGGMKVSFLLAMPAAKGLFHRAIIQSGPGLRATSREAATEAAKGLLEKLGIAPGDLSKLETVPAEAIQDAAKALPAELRGRGFSPCVDGIALPRDPFHPDAPELTADVPVMIGTNKDEATLFLRADPKFGSFTDEEVEPRITRQARDKGPALTALLRKTFPDYSPTHLIAAAQTLTGMWNGSVLLAERKAAQKGGPVFAYILEWETPVARGALKSPHALEIPLAFDNVERARDFVGRGDDPQVLANQLSEVWLAFARTGNPNNLAIPEWPAYDAETRATMMFNLESRVENDPYSEVRQLLNS